MRALLVTISIGAALLRALPAPADVVDDCGKWFASLEGTTASMTIRDEQNDAQRRRLLAMIDAARAAGHAGKLGDAATRIREFRHETIGLAKKGKVSKVDDQTLMMLTGTVLQCLATVGSPPG